MPDAYFADQVFDAENFPGDGPVPGDYENCRFNGLDLGGLSFNGIHFIDCRFTDCNLSNLRIDSETSFRDVLFDRCKMQGLVFADGNPFLFSASFAHCMMRYASFHTMKIRKTSFSHCDMQEIDFTGADLSESVLDHCDLLNAHFENTILEKTDLRTAFNYSIDPERNKLKKARFSLPAAVGLLDKYDLDIS